MYIQHLSQTDTIERIIISTTYISAHVFTF